MEQKIALMAKLLEADGMSLEVNGNGRVILTKEGEFVCELPDDVVELLLKGTQREVAHTCGFIDATIGRVFNKGYSAGKTAGREEICAAAHQLLGIDRLVEALSKEEA